jgi:hypothetical protein
VLLTRSPLSPGPKARFSLDLHVLSAPPAFVLSQDQTLREGLCCRRTVSRTTPPADLSLRASYFAQRPWTLLDGTSRATTRLKPSHPSRPCLGRPSLPEIEVLDIEERSLLSFQRPVPHRVRRRKKGLDSRQRPPWKRIVSDTSRAGRLLWSSCRDFRTPPTGRPGKYSGDP